MRYGNQSGLGVLQHLKKMESLMNEAEKAMIVGEVNGHHFVVVVTPLHRRVIHYSPEFMDMLFIDSTGVYYFYFCSSS